MRLKTFFLILLICLSSSSLALEVDPQDDIVLLKDYQLKYIETDTGKKPTEKSYTLKKGPSGYKLIIESVKAITEASLDKQLRTLELTHSSNGGSDKVLVKRDKCSISFLGIKNGKQLNKKVSIDSDVWYAAPILLAGFALSDSQSESFYMITPGNQEVIKFKAIKDEEEMLVVRDKNYHAIKIRITMTDWRGAFWNSYYWFRMSDGIMVKAQELRGSPTKPFTNIELIEEK